MYIDILAISLLSELMYICFTVLFNMNYIWQTNQSCAMNKPALKNSQYFQTCIQPKYALASALLCLLIFFLEGSSSRCSHASLSSFTHVSSEPSNIHEAYHTLRNSTCTHRYTYLTNPYSVFVLLAITIITTFLLYIFIIRFFLLEPKLQKLSKDSL